LKPSSSRRAAQRPPVCTKAKRTTNDLFPFHTPLLSLFRFAFGLRLVCVCVSFYSLVFPFSGPVSSTDLSVESCSYTPCGTSTGRGRPLASPQPCSPGQCCSSAPCTHAPAWVPCHRSTAPCARFTPPLSTTTRTSTSSPSLFVPPSSPKAFFSSDVAAARCNTHGHGRLMPARSTTRVAFRAPRAVHLPIWQR
jgi:hypothetical protein